jgi:hypothetical protein
MTKLTRFILGATTALVAGAAAAGEATVFSNPDFRGRALTLNAADPDITARGMRDVDSIIVHSGRWEFCARPGFGGRCEVLGPGRYSSLREDWRHPIESVREIGIPTVRRGAIELYANAGFRGPRAAVDRDLWNFERRNLDDRVSSVIVNEGRWELCTNRGYEGRCRVFGPGEYPQIGPRLEDNVNSLRRIG